jgi:hypothetical protein
MLPHMVDTATVTLVKRTTHNRMRILSTSLGQGRSRLSGGSGDYALRSVKMNLFLFGEGRDGATGTTIAPYGALGKSRGYKTCT